MGVFEIKLSFCFGKLVNLYFIYLCNNDLLIKIFDCDRYVCDIMFFNFVYLIFLF